MILKSADDKFPSIAKLEVLLKTGRVPPDKTALVEKELRTLKAGIKGEEESAYQIDFRLRDSKATMVLHDLRFELPDGRVAQIDHLLIHRSYRFYVLETKNFSHGLKITDEGEFLRWNDWKRNFEGIPSPIEQNERHVLVLQKLIESLGLPAPTIKALVLISPTARIDRSKKFDSSMVVKADQFLSALESDLSDASFVGLLGGIAKAAWNGSHEEIAKKLIACHRPVAINYVAKFGLAGQAVAPLAPAPEAPSPAPSESPPATAPIAPEGSSEKHVCRACSSENLSIEYGKYGYYFKCRDCSGNTPIKLGCGHSAHKERLRKEGPRFFRECADCDTSSLYFQNP
jgi:hypothetical protein